MKDDYTKYFYRSPFEGTELEPHRECLKASLKKRPLEDRDQSLVRIGENLSRYQGKKSKIVT